MPLDGVGAAFENAVVSHPDSDSIATRAFLRALSHAAPRSVVAPRARISLTA